MWFPLCLLYFFFNDTETTEIYTLSLHDALPIYCHIISGTTCVPNDKCQWQTCCYALLDRKSTRLNSRHVAISYAVFCLKKKIASSRHSRSWGSIAHSSRPAIIKNILEFFLKIEVTPDITPFPQPPPFFC